MQGGRQEQPLSSYHRYIQQDIIDHAPFDREAARRFTRARRLLADAIESLLRSPAEDRNRRHGLLIQQLKFIKLNFL